MKLSHTLTCAALAVLASTLPWSATALAETKKPAAQAELGMQEARALVMALPEVQAWEEARRVEAKSRTDGKPPGGVLTGLRQVKGVKHWAVTFYLEPQTTPKKWAVFLVRAKDGRIFVEVDGGAAQTLEQWREAQPAK